MAVPLRGLCGLRHGQRSLLSNLTPKLQEQTIFARGPCPACRSFSRSVRRTKPEPQPADDPNFQSIIDNPPVLVRTGKKKHGWGILLLAAMPVTAFFLGAWQVKRLEWKTDLIAKLEDRLIREPLPLPPRIDPEAVSEFDYRRVYTTGRFRHDQEMLIGPRMRDGNEGYMVVTPLERDGDGSTILVNRGWIAKTARDQKSRPEGLPRGEVTVEGLIREPWKKNMFTPENRPDLNEFYFPDVQQMASLTGSQPIWIEETMDPDLLEQYRRESRGIPIARAAEVNLRNNHTQYIFTWFGLSAATSIMLWMVLKKPPRDLARRVRQNKEW